MIERRYTVTEVKRLCWQLVHGEIVSIDDYLAMLPPDPEPSGEVVERIDRYTLDYLMRLDNDGDWVKYKDLTAEVTRQVEERTREVGRQLDTAVNILEASKCFVMPKTISIARDEFLKALANKGGSDE